MAKSPVLLDATEMTDFAREMLYAEVEAWHSANNALASAKELEMKLRNNLVAKYFVGAKEGTNKVRLGFGKVLSAQVKVNRVVDEAELNALKAKATAEGNNAVIAAISTVIAYKPSVVIGEYKDLSDELKVAFANAITEKPGTPSLDIETPKR